jgi:hypothetical protein
MGLYECKVYDGGGNLKYVHTVAEILAKIDAEIRKESKGSVVLRNIVSSEAYTRQCKRCSKEFTSAYSLRVFCHSPCKAGKRKPKPTVMNTCQLCKETYPTSYRKGKFCKHPCTYTMWRSVKEKREVRKKQCIKNARTAKSGTKSRKKSGSTE